MCVFVFEVVPASFLSKGRKCSHESKNLRMFAQTFRRLHKSSCKRRILGFRISGTPCKLLYQLGLGIEANDSARDGAEAQLEPKSKHFNLDLGLASSLHCRSFLRKPHRTLNIDRVA